MSIRKEASQGEIPSRQGQPTLAPGWENAIQDVVTELSLQSSTPAHPEWIDWSSVLPIWSRDFHTAAFTWLSSLGISGYTVQKPIPVTVRQDGDEFVATFFDANISTGGDTEQEAVANLQSLIADFYDDLVTTPDEKLGPSPKAEARSRGVSMPDIMTEDAEAIARKLTRDTPKQPGRQRFRIEVEQGRNHEKVKVWYGPRWIGQYGIQRSSKPKKHNYVAEQLHLSRNDAYKFGQMPA